MKASIIILLLLRFIKAARRDRALVLWHTFLQRLLTWSSNFKFLSIVIPIVIRQFNGPTIYYHCRWFSATYKKVTFVTIRFHKVDVEPLKT